MQCTLQQELASHSNPCPVKVQTLAVTGTVTGMCALSSTAAGLLQDVHTLQAGSLQNSHKGVFRLGVGMCQVAQNLEGGLRLCCGPALH